MKKRRTGEDRIIHRIIPDRYADPKRIKLYTYYNEFVVYDDHCRLLVRRMDTREVMVTVLFDKEKLDEVEPVHWTRSAGKLSSLSGRIRGKKRMTFGRALGLAYNGRAFARVSAEVFDFRSNRVIPMTDLRFEEVDADTMKLLIRRPSDGMVYHVLFDREDFDAVRDVGWFVDESKSRNSERVTIKGGLNRKNVLLDALLLGFPETGFVRKYSRYRRELDFRKKALAKRITRNTYRAVSAHVVWLTISRPDREDIRVRLDKTALAKISKHRWTVKRYRNSRTGRGGLLFFDEERKSLPDVVLGTRYMGAVPKDAKGVYDCRRRCLLGQRQINLCAPLGKNGVRLKILHPEGTTTVLLDKAVYDRLKDRSWWVIPAGPKGCCQIRNSSGTLMQFLVFKDRYHHFERVYWKMSKPIDFRRAALIDHLRGSIYRRLDRHSGELQVLAGKRIVRVRVDHEDVRRKLRRHKWLCEMPANGRPLRIFCDRHACMLRVITGKRLVVILDPEFDEDGRIDCRKRSLARWCPENHYRFLDDKRMELVVPVIARYTVMRILLDREDYDRLRGHVWRAYLPKEKNSWLVNSVTGMEIKALLFSHRFRMFKGLADGQDARLLDYRKARLSRHAISSLVSGGDTSARPLSPEKRVQALKAYIQRRQRQVGSGDTEQIYVSDRYLALGKPGNHLFFNEIVVMSACAELQIRRLDTHAPVWRIRLDKADWPRVAEVHWLYRPSTAAVSGIINKKNTTLKRFLGPGYHAATAVYEADPDRDERQKARPPAQAPNNRYERVDDRTMKLYIRRTLDDAVFEILFDSEDYLKIRPYSWWVAVGKTTSGEYLDVRALHKGKVLPLRGHLLGPKPPNRKTMDSPDMRCLDYRKQSMTTGKDSNSFRTLPDGSVEMTLHRPGKQTYRVLIDARDYPAVSGYHWAPFFWRKKNGEQKVFFGAEGGPSLIVLLSRGGGNIGTPDLEDGVYDYRRRNLLKNDALNRYVPVDERTVRLEIEDLDGTVRVLLDQEDCKRLQKVHWLFTVEDARTGLGVVRNKMGHSLQRVIFRNRVDLFSKTVWCRDESIDFRKKKLMAYVASSFFEPVGDDVLEMRLADKDGWLGILVDRKDKTRLRRYRWRCERSPETGRVRVLNQRDVSLPTFLLGLKTPYPETIDLKRDRQGRIDCRKQFLRNLLDGKG